MSKINSLTDEENVRLNKQADAILGMIAKCENKSELQAVTLVSVLLARCSEDEWRFCEKAADWILSMKMKASIAEAIQYVKELDAS